MTTIEVLAGTILLAFLIVAVLELSAQYQRQRLLARTRIEACQRIDDLLFDWYLLGDALPANSSGPLPGGTFDLIWESQTEELEVMEGVKVGHLRLNVFESEYESDVPADLAPILSISLLVSMEEPTEDLLEEPLEGSSNPIDEDKP